MPKYCHQDGCRSGVTKGRGTLRDWIGRYHGASYGITQGKFGDYPTVHLEQHPMHIQSSSRLVCGEG